MRSLVEVSYVDVQGTRDGVPPHTSALSLKGHTDRRTVSQKGVGRRIRVQHDLEDALHEGRLNFMTGSATACRAGFDEHVTLTGMPGHKFAETRYKRWRPTF
jgi:hypothetical protein